MDLTRSKLQVRKYLIECIRKEPDFTGWWHRRLEQYVFYDEQKHCWTNGAYRWHLKKNRRKWARVNGLRMLDGCPLRSLLFNAYLLHGHSCRDSNTGIEMREIYKAFQDAKRKVAKRKKREEQLASLQPMTWRAHREIAEKMAYRLHRHTTKCHSLVSPCKHGVISHACDQVWSRGRWHQWWTSRLRRKGFLDRNAHKHVQEILDTFCPTEEPKPACPKRGLRTCSQNFNSLNQNGRSFLDGLDRGMDVIAGQESRLGTGKWNMQKHYDWKLVDFPRDDTSGGTCFLLRDNLIFESLKSSWRRLPGANGQPGVEWLWIKVSMENGWMYMASVYAPISTTVPLSREAALTLRAQIDEFRMKEDCVGVMIFGDFNSTWYTTNVTNRRNMGSTASNVLGKGREWRDALSGGSVVVNDSLIRPNDEESIDPSCWASRLGTNNRKSTLIDYGVWFGPEDKVRSVYMRDVDGPDHRTLVVELKDLCTPTVALEHFQFAKLQDEEVLQVFQTQLTEALDNLDHPSYDEWMATLKRTLREVCGVRRRRSRLYCSQNKWWSRKLKELTKKKKTWLRRKWRLARRQLDLDLINEKLVFIKRRIRKELSRAQSKYWRTIKEGWDRGGESLKQAFGILRRSQRKGSDVNHSRQVMEETWSEIISSAPPEDCQEGEAEEELNQAIWDAFPAEAHITPEELSNGLKKLPNGKASGEDAIPNEVLKALPEVAVSRLCDYFNGMLENPETIPEDWYKSLVVMIPKEDQPEPLDFRPITLLSCVAKCLEKVLWERIKLLNIELHFNQGGFVLKRGCPEQGWLLKTLSEALRAANGPNHRRGRTGVALFLDIAKAYDCVPHSILIRRLREEFPALPHYFIKFCARWIKGHVRKILVDGSPASELAVGRGLPQGSILAPFLFNCFINCLITRLKEAMDGISVGISRRHADEAYDILCKVLGFADDLCCTAISASDLQRALDVCAEWARENGMRFNPGKCKFMNLGKNDQRVKRWRLTFDEEELEYTAKFPYLGVVYSASLRHKHLDSSRFLEEIRNVELPKKFVIYDACHGCPVFVGVVIISLRWLPQLLYGAELFSVNPTRTNLNHQTVWGSLGKRVLGAYRTDSTSKVLEFLGLRDIADYRNKRIINFTIKMLTCEFDELRNPMLAVLDSELPWAMDVKEQFRIARAKGMFVVHDEDADDNGENLLAGVDFANFGETLSHRFEDREHMNEFFRRVMKVYVKQWELKKPKPHPAVWNAPINGHIAFRFLSGRFQPLDQQPPGEFPDACVLCSAVRGDVPNHLPGCDNVKVQSIISKGMQRCGLDANDAGSRETFVDCLKEPTRQRFSQLGVADDKWEVVCKSMRNLWHLRTQQWKRNRNEWRE